MIQFLHGVARAVAETFALPGPILEVGSYQVDGEEAIADMRSLFPGRPYLGMDIRPGPGVDLVGSVEEVPQADASVGTVISLSTFEHVRRFWRGFDEVHRVLRPDGALLVCCPFNVRIHNHPSDYWRFTPEALEVLLEPYPHKIVGWHGPAERPENVWALAFREEAPPISAAQFTRYRTLLGRYGRQPMRWRRKLRYHLIDWFHGRRLCAPFLERERWESTCVSPPDFPAKDSSGYRAAG
jgi:SAM-dependent methyltransferase